MKKYKLDKEEQEILDAVENDEFVSILTPAREKELQEAAKETLKRIQKDKNINIRLSMEDLTKLKEKAYQNGLPYQTIVSTLIHQYNKGKVTIEL
jgi:predicted DNA binding CopG/RHH family protein